MSEISRFWITGGATGDQVSGYNATDLQEFNRTMFLTNAGVEAVAKGLYGDLVVTAGSGLVSVAAGIANVYGLWYKSDLAFNIAVATPASATRIDRIILRANMTSSTYGTQVGYTVKCVRLAGAEGTGLAPSLTQNSNQWEVSLATVSITTGGAITVTNSTDKYMNPPIVIGGGNLSATLTYAGVMTLAQSGPDLLFRATSGATDEQYWDFAAAASAGSGTGRFYFRALNTALNSATNVFTVTRGAGVAVTDITFGVPLIAGSTFQASSTATFLAGTTLSNASPAFFIHASGQATNEQYWLQGVNPATNTWSIVAINNALNAATNVIAADRGTGVALTSMTIGDTGVPVTFPGSITPTGGTLINRQSGSVSVWNSPGASNYTQAHVMQVGAATSDASAVVTVTFPVAFSNVPIVTGTCTSAGSTNTVMITTLSASSVSFRTSSVSITFYWIAIGPPPP